MNGTGIASTVEIRELTSDNMAELLDWRMEVLDVVFADDAPWDAEQIRAANARYFEKNLGATCIACIASVDGIDAGCGAICLQEELPSPDNPGGTCAYLMNIYTRNEFRKHGIARAVVSWLIENARERGIDKIYLESTAAGRPLYETMGFKDMQGMMKLS